MFNWSPQMRLFNDMHFYPRINFYIWPSVRMQYQYSTHIKLSWEFTYVDWTNEIHMVFYLPNVELRLLTNLFLQSLMMNEDLPTAASPARTTLYIRSGSLVITCGYTWTSWGLGQMIEFRWYTFSFTDIHQIIKDNIHLAFLK